MRIRLIGLGWLGEPLAWFLQEAGYEVKGSTTSAEKADRLVMEGIAASPLLFNPYPEGAGLHLFFDAEVLFINIPPKRNPGPEGFYLSQIRNIKSLAAQAGVKKIIYISSTSVYPDHKQRAEESDELGLRHTGNPNLLQAENILWQDKSYDLTVIRFGGLFGGNRIPGNYFSNKSQVVGDTPVNCIHRHDAVRLVHWVLSEQLWNRTFNGVAPLHPSRKEIYEINAREFSFDPPLDYQMPGLSSWKIVSCEKIVRTGFTYLFEDPRDFIYDYVR